MSYFRFVVALCGILFACATAFAADLQAPVYKAPAWAPAGHSWDGFYLGLVAGGALQNSNFDDKSCALTCSSWNVNGSGFTVGGTAGWNYQVGSGVIGIESDLNWANFQGSFTDPQWTSKQSAKWDGFATVRGRAGLAFDRVLMYATGGVAFVKVDDFAEGNQPPGGCTTHCYSLNNVQTGIVVGAGAEYALSGPWSAKTEYLYVALPSKRVHDSIATASNFTYAVNSDAHIIRFGLNYSFGGQSANAKADGSFAMASLGAPSNWTGLYVGAVAGGALQNTIIDDRNCNLSCASQNLDGSGFTAGGTLGWNQQFGHGLLGVEADFNWGNFKGSLTDPSWKTNGSAQTSEWEWFSTVRGRAGLVVGNTLIYATGGLAFVDLKASGSNANGACDSNGCFSISGVQTGFAAGFGAEYALGGSWTVKGEYLYIGLPTENAHDLVRTHTYDTYNTKSDAQMVRLGLNYHVNPIGTGSPMPALLLSQWSGFYVGAVAGGALQNTVLVDKRCNLSCSSQTMNGSGFTAGGTAGWNHQFGAGVVGVEADFNWANFKDNFTDPNFNSNRGTIHSAEWKWFSTVRGRVGIVVDRTFIYATGGLAFVDVNDFGHSLNNGCDNEGCFSISGVQTGIAAGFGAEYALAGPWSAKAEYLYVGLPNKNTQDLVLASTSNIYSAKSEAHIVRLGVNYHLN